MRLVALVATTIIDASNDPLRAHSCLLRAAKWAELAVKRVNVLEGEAATTAADAARRDYITLLELYGVHKEAIIGDPIDCFDETEWR